MFKQLITNLPFNPSLADQLGSYQVQLQRQARLRAIGVVLLGAATAATIFIAANPPERSLTTAPHNTLQNVSSPQDIITAWDDPQSDVKALYQLFGISRADLLTLTPTTLKPRGNNYHITTRLPYGPNGTQVDYNALNYQFLDQSGNAYTAYQSPLSDWTNASLPAFAGTTSGSNPSGARSTFWILSGSGDLVTQTPFDKSADPRLQASLSILDPKPAYAPGDQLTLLINYRNAESNSLAQDVSLDLQLDPRFFNLPDRFDDPYHISNSFIKYTQGNLAYSGTYHSLPIQVTLNDQIDSGSNLCNSLRLVASNAQLTTSPERCITIINPCQQPGSSNNPNCLYPKVACSAEHVVAPLSNHPGTIHTTLHSTNRSSTFVSGYTYTVDGQTVQQNSSLSGQDSYLLLTQLTDQTAVTVGATYTTISDDQPQQIDCPLTLQRTNEPRIGQHLSQQTTNDGTVVYMLRTFNTSSTKRDETTTQLFTADLTEYYDLAESDLAAANFTAGNSSLSWDAQTIEPYSQLSRSFSAAPKQTIATTNQPSQVATSYDCAASLRFGNTIAQTLNCPTIKHLDTGPNIAARSAIIPLATLTLIAGYLTARTHLLSRELAAIKKEYL